MLDAHMKTNNKIRVNLTYSWDFNEKEWDENLKSLKDLEVDLNLKVEYDCVNMFHHLSDIVRPEIRRKVVAPLSKKSN